MFLGPNEPIPILLLLIIFLIFSRKKKGAKNLSGKTLGYKFSDQGEIMFLLDKIIIKMHAFKIKRFQILNHKL